MCKHMCSFANIACHDAGMVLAQQNNDVSGSHLCTCATLMNDEGLFHNAQEGLFQHAQEG